LTKSFQNDECNDALLEIHASNWPYRRHDFPSTLKQNKGGKAKSNIENLKSRFLQGRITRREFLAQVSALGLAAALSPSILGTAARAATPKSGGRCRIAYNDCGMSDNLDPTISNSNCSSLLTMQMVNALVV
jgi:hypothetical protein